MGTNLERALRFGAKQFVEKQVQVLGKAQKLRAPRNPSNSKNNCRSELSSMRKLSKSGSYLYDPNRHIALLQSALNANAGLRNKKAP